MRSRSNHFDDSASPDATRHPTRRTDPSVRQSSSQLTAHSSQLTAHSSQPTARGNLRLCASSRGLVTHGFKAMAVRIENKRRVVPRTVPRSKPRITIRHASMSNSRAKEGIHFASGTGGQGQMKSSAWRDKARSMLDRKLITLSQVAISDRIGAGPQAHNAERREGSIVEQGCAFEVGGAEREMIQHTSTRRIPESRAPQGLQHSRPHCCCCSSRATGNQRFWFG